jgi:tetrahydromethanopterin S-methyltransferase subunit F
MPRAYDQIVTILNRLNAVRANIDALNTTLEQVCYHITLICRNLYIDVRARQCRLIKHLP